MRDVSRKILFWPRTHFLCLGKRELSTCFNCLFSERELCQRRALREAGIKHVEKMSTFDDSVSLRKTYALDDEDNRCTVSNKICYLSMASLPVCLMVHSHCSRTRPRQIPVTSTQNPMEIYCHLSMCSVNTSKQFYTRKSSCVNARGIPPAA